MITNVVDFLLHSAERAPEQIAITDGTHSITYKDLLSKVIALGSHIEDVTSGQKNKPIAVYLEKSIDAIVSFLAIAYTGNFYCPLDISSPKERTSKILSNLNPVAIVSHATPSLELPTDAINICLQELNLDDISSEKIYFPAQIVDTNPLYVIYTSGSTGTPKGVTISHRAVVDYIDWVHETFNFNQNTILGSQAPFFFDNSILDIYGALKSCATLVLIPSHLFTFPHLLISFLNQQHINTIFWVPSALINLASSDSFETDPLHFLKNVLFCGEVMPNKYLNIWRKKYSNILYANLYGPTEITDVCTYYMVDRSFRDEDPLPIGFPCKNTEILVLDENDNLVENDQIGELCVRGTCLSMGYYNDSEKTAKAFVQNPLNSSYRDLIYRTGDLVQYNQYGELLYIGRKDFQIKHQGYRIELGEIEAAAISFPEVQQCCVLYDLDKKHLVLFASLNNEITDRDIYQKMKVILPKYMLPTKIHILDQLPLTPNGKIDRVTLKDSL